MSKFTPPHPGLLIMCQLIKDEDGNYIDSIDNVAEKLGYHRTTLYRIVSGKVAITPEMALALENIGAGSAEHWLSMQAAYDLDRLRHVIFT